ncbi:MAG TPA: MFS transporter [Chlorobaculum parvum]|uniref:MFS transporter n=1 Tax=Chlorobaculum parvum TaxID=274539 RepID=A0A7C5HRZ2_9CHLB|nr:MFS transporter [Chlorobaculum parvum]
MMVTFAFPLYFKNVICQGDPQGDQLWGNSVSISMLLVALISPVLGAQADYSGRRKRFLLVFTLVSVIATALLSFSGPGNVLPAAMLFILANIGFEGGLVFYDAYLPEITSRRSIGRVSGYGFAMGYLGALVILLLLQPLLMKGIDESNIPNLQLSFLVVTLFFAVFSAPLFFTLRDTKGKAGLLPDETGMRNRKSSVLHSLQEVGYTIRHIMNYPDLARFLLAFFFYNDAILTVIAFASIYAQNTLGFTATELIKFFITVQTTAIVGSIVFGFVTDRIGPKRAIVLTLFIWIFVIFLAIFASTKQSFFVTGLVAGLSMGSSQAASRSLMARLTPKEHRTEFFGFYDGSFGKASAVIGPLVFGFVSVQAGSQKAALASLLLFFAIGLLILTGVSTSATNPEEAVQRDGQKLGKGRLDEHDRAEF